MTVKKNLICKLYGGLGNQFFQYAFAITLAKKTNRNLFFLCKEILYYKVITNKKNYLELKNNLKSYNNKIYLLDLLDINMKKTSIFFNLFFFIYRFLKYFKKKIKILNYLLPKLKFEIIQEKDQNYDNSLINECITSDAKNLIISGYWQSRKYFIDQELNIFKSIRISESKKNNFKKIFNLITSSNSVALCARIYEEVPTVNTKKLIDEDVMDGIPNLEYYQNCINIICDTVKNPVFFVFSVKEYEFFKFLQIKEKIFYINNDNGYNGTIDNLWLMSNCKYQIISYSSYYWLSAWYSKFNNKSSIVYRPKHKHNKKNSYYCSDWKEIEY